MNKIVLMLYLLILSFSIYPNFHLKCEKDKYIDLKEDLKKADLTISYTTSNLFESTTKIFHGETIGKLKDLLSKSKKSWEELKEKNKNSYQYTINSMNWSGDGSFTIVTVINGAFVKQKICSWDKNQKIINSIEESEIDIEKTKKPFFIDEIYNICQQNYINKTDDRFYLSISFNSENILSSCFLVDHYLADGKQEGFYFTNFRWLKKDEIYMYTK
ncbi:hypothetical protein JXR93_05330 [bacterium]|nr:hypothetical protein [bacterium]